MRHKNKFLAWIMAGIIIMGLTGCAAAEENEIMPQDNSGYENSEGEAEITGETTPAVTTTTPDVTTMSATTTEQTTTTAAVIEEISTTTEIPVTEETSIITETEETSEIFETQNAPTQNNDDEKYLVKTEFGDYVDLRDAYKIEFHTPNGNGREEMTLNEAMEKEYVFYQAFFEGFSYATKSSGKSYNSIDNIFDDDENKFITDDEYLEHEYNYFKVSEGDKFESLSVKEATVVFGGDFKYGEKSDVSSELLHIYFLGDVTLRGYISLALPTENHYGTSFNGGYIAFFVDAISWGDIPIITPNSFKLPELTYRVNNFEYSSDMKMFYLWELDEYRDFDLSVIPKNGNFALVDITLSEIDISKVNAISGEFYRGAIKSLSPINY